ncbi:MAG: hypothetical protein AAF665_17155 [Pseudomonadota bacterium]
MTVEFEPTRASGLRRLQEFVPHAGKTYAVRRNYDLGPGQHSGVSMLSPYVCCRLVSEEEIVTSVL